MSRSMEQKTIFNQGEGSKGIQESELQEIRATQESGAADQSVKTQESHKKEIIINGLPLLKITKTAFHYYRNITKRNSKISYINARKKLTRNTMLSMILEQYQKGDQEWTVYAYGQLKIVVAGDTIVHLYQMKESPEGFYYNKRRRASLSKRLRISNKR